MVHNSPKKLDRTNAVVALVVWLAVLAVYWMTKAPTFSFWDCGEFVAASYILGIPHPPGTPLYVLVGRVFSLLPLSSDIAVRVNLLSSVASAFAALFGYLVAVRLLRNCIRQDNSVLSRVLTYGGAAAGAFFFAFSLTNWNNSVETEVYGLSMLLFMAMVWLALVYRENSSGPFGQRAMLLVFYLAFAGIGVHLSSFLALPAVALLFVLRKDIPRHVWFIIGAFIVVELYLIFAMSSRPNEIPYYVPVVIVFLVYLFYMFSFEQIPGIYIAVAAGFLLSVLPVAASVINALRSAGESTGDGAAYLNTIGTIGFIGLNAFALYLLIDHLRHRPSDDRGRHRLMASLFVLVAGVLTVILIANIRGYQQFLMASAVLGLIMMISLRRYLNWPVLIATVAVFLVVVGVKEVVVAMAVAAVLIPVIGLVFKQPGWRNALLILLMAVLGYSVHLFIPIRSARQPVMNENNPSQNLTALINFVERKQYGSQSMVERMFKRRAEWENQFGDFHRMGFWHFFKQQYGLTGVRHIPLFVIGLYGLWEILRRRPKQGIPFLVLIVLASIGLVLYMNFADGTRQHPVTGLDYIEVRDRDYFFTPAFTLFGLAIGIGLASVIQFIREALGASSGSGRKVMVYASLVLLMLPAYTIGSNYFPVDRSRNYIPYDYAWNILVCAEPDAVLVTAGDNDTFPLWCIQEVYGVRKDVAVVNLSLANARWYIKQLQTALGIDLRWTESDIDSMVVFRDQYGNVHRLPDQVVSRIIATNYGRRPINFSVTVPPGDRKYMGRPIDSLLTMRGMVWSLDRTGGSLTIDVDASIDLYTSPDNMRFRGINDKSIYKDETTLRLTRNYVNSFMIVSDSLLAAKDFTRAEMLMEKAIEYVPYSTDGVHYLGALYAEQGKRDRLKALIETTKYGDKRWLTTILGRLEERMGNGETAEGIFSDLLRRYPNYRPPMEDLLRLYYERREVEKMKQVLAVWLSNNPGDAEMKGLLDNIDVYLKQVDSAGDE